MRILGPTPPRLPLGYSDYVDLRRAGCTYVDKTRFVAHVLKSGAKTQLYPRPRRFGKTLNLSTARHYFERGAPDLTSLFADTEIWELDDGRHRAHFQRHPVIWLTFKDVKFKSWNDTWLATRQLLQQELLRLWSAHNLGGDGNADWATQRARLLSPDAPPAALAEALIVLSRWCAEATGEQVVILIDEYDAPLLTAWQHGYWAEAIDFFRPFLSSGLKDNPHLFRSAFTGILRVAKEGVFSGLNNVEVYGLLTPAPSITAFGFTEDEVGALATAYGLAEQLPEIARWYNGYRFGGLVPETLYNPWSLIQFLNNPAAGYLAHWLNTSANDLIEQLLLRHAADAGPDIQRLIRGETISTRVEESIPLTALDRSAVALWSLLLFSGYLTAERTQNSSLGPVCELRVPNLEVSAVYHTTFLAVMNQEVSTGSADALAQAMLSGDVALFERKLGHLLKTAMSFFDFGARPLEAVYQAFVIGLLVHLEPTHRVRSNRESGFGRADVLIMPRQPGPGVVLELKVIDSDYEETRESALAAAVKQLTERQYATEVREAGASVVYQYAVVFDGKRCWTELVPEAG